MGNVARYQEGKLGMAHNIDMSNGKANIAFLGDRNDIWHRLGQEMVPGQSIDEWARQAGLDWHAVQVPAFADLSGQQFDHIRHYTSDRHALVDNALFTVRSDTGMVLGYATERRKEHQPAEVLAWFEQYLSADDRFALDVAGSLKGGKIIWATAKFNADLTVAGDSHRSRLLMTTAFDGTQSTTNKMSMTRVVCNNTLDAALASDKRAVVKTRHNTRFDAARVGKELGDLASSVDSYKQMGDAMARVHLSKEEMSKFFKSMLDIPFEAKRDDISTRKLNQFEQLNQAYVKTLLEGSDKLSAWSALNAVTRYVDHERSTRGNGSDDEARVLSSQFGSGAAMKAAAVQTLVRDFVSIAPSKTASDDAWIGNVLSGTRATGSLFAPA